MDEAGTISETVAHHEGLPTIPQGESEQTIPTFKAKCPRCGKVFEKETQILADQAARMHLTIAHKLHRGKQLGRPPKKKSVELVGAPPETETLVTLNYCPHCGTDLHKVATAIALAKKLG